MSRKYYLLLFAYYLSCNFHFTETFDEDKYELYDFFQKDETSRLKQNSKCYEWNHLTKEETNDKVLSNAKNPFLNVSKNIWTGPLFHQHFFKTKINTLFGSINRNKISPKKVFKNHKN